MVLVAVKSRNTYISYLNLYLNLYVCINAFISKDEFKLGITKQYKDYIRIPFGTAFNVLEIRVFVG